MNTPYIAIQITENVYTEMKALHVRAAKPISDEDKALGADLLAQTYVQLLDTCFTHLLDELNKTQADKMLQDASKVIHKVQSEAQHYIGWLVKFIANKRVPPVIHHFHDMVHVLNLNGQTHPYIVIPVTSTYAESASDVMFALANKESEKLNEGVELLIEAIETALVPLVYTPKDLMGFNFVISKTINGVINVLHRLFKHTLRKLPPHIQEESCPPIAKHFEVFLIRK
ncbi:hypothetical protein [Limnobacter parvus]|uniref:Uncharacterized protein n=1 Tax=Limnobacter parvus TaxID=2939690 RepID=A0ABT1XK22_9BURK|nr:hypothetical protein [Limnobacter parvus]MCR2747641.1 hypothetical protein [Limnobacter parvus]